MPLMCLVEKVCLQKVVCSCLTKHVFFLPSEWKVSRVWVVGLVPPPPTPQFVGPRVLFRLLEQLFEKVNENCVSRTEGDWKGKRDNKH